MVPDLDHSAYAVARRLEPTTAAQPKITPSVIPGCRHAAATGAVSVRSTRGPSRTSVNVCS